MLIQFRPLSGYCHHGRLSILRRMLQWTVCLIVSTGSKLTCMPLMGHVVAVLQVGPLSLICLRPE
uniref:Uncharacterized protein n=1 Tax=Anguilla anguilla TaxID=7936 RepID=A0A0E9RKG7_ANGAN